MSDIQTPNGLEANETLVGATDEIEVYQPASGGIRRNKKAFLDTLKTFFQIITGGVLNNIVTFGGSSNIQDSGIGISDLNANTVHRSSDGSDHTFIDQDVKVAASPTFANATISGHNVDTQLDRIDQDVKVAASPVFAGETLNGALLPTATPVRDTETVLAGQNFVLPRGVWNIAFDDNPTSSDVFLKINIGGNWVKYLQRSSVSTVGHTAYGVCVFSDGTNVRVENIGGTSYRFHYQRY